MTPARSTPTPDPGPVRRVLRGAVAVLAWCFAAGVALQVSLVGLAIFDQPARWLDHVAVGHGLGVVALLLPLLTLASGLGRGAVGLAFGLLLLFGLQYGFVALGGAAGALHALNALALFWLALRLATAANRPSDSQPRHVRATA